jgi:hypothetical protein
LYNISLLEKRLLCYLFIITVAFQFSITSAAGSPTIPVSLADKISNGNVHIVAVMVDFQPDENPYTTGNGTFNPDFLQRNIVTLDPLPHDKSYFEAHLEFAKNYFQTVSNNRITISYEVLPEIVTLPNEMAAYSPLGLDGDENFKLADLSRDTWEIVKNNGTLEGRIFNPERTMYIIFHTGAGRDLELTGTTLIKTPQDIPSVFLSQNSFQRLLNDPVFNGFQVSSTNFVTNTAILPETQSRPGEDVLGNEFVLELSINGILTATVGSYLGLPDLFNTETGRSGIGRFGLMDGAGFFSYFGLFPPEPSAWEKVYMGWIDPIDITQNVNTGQTFTVPAVSLHEPGSVFKYSISSDEYFLIENRHRDPLGNGVELTIQQPDGSIQTITLDNSETRFNGQNFSEIDEILPAGVLTNISNFDWSLPGGLDPGDDRTNNTDDDRELNGGILVWHVDEKVINARLADNTVNNDINRRGVRLLEADGAQDIGKMSLGVTGYDQGQAFDFWWSGNDFTVITTTGERIVLYQNRLGDDTYPNNRSNSGAKTYFEIYDFSDNLPEASFKIRLTSDSQIRLLYDSPKIFGHFRQVESNQSAYPYSLNVWSNPIDTFLVVPRDENIYVVKMQRGPHYHEATSYSFTNAAQPLITQDGKLVLSTKSSPEDPIPVKASTLVTNLESFIDRPLIRYFELDDTYSGAFPSTADNNTINLDRSPFRFDLTSGSISNSGTIDQYNGAQGILTGSIRNNQIFNENQPIYQLSSNETQSDRLHFAPVTGFSGQQAFLYWTTQYLQPIDAVNGDEISRIDLTNFSWPILKDIDQDGVTDILFINYDENTLEIRNLYGAMLPDFPVNAPVGMTFTGVPLLLEPTANHDASIIVLVDDGVSTNILIYNLDDLRFPAHTLLVGSSPEFDIMINPVVVDGILYAISADGQIVRWELTWRDDKPTAYIYDDHRKNRISDYEPTISQPSSAELLVDSETYNWPNPANEKTYIRVLTGELADISFNMINYSGQKILEKNFSSPGGLPIEHEINTSSLSNGVYFARISASANGKTAHKVLTIVVIR